MKRFLSLVVGVMFVVGCSGATSDEPEPTDPNAPPATTLPGAPAPGAPNGTTTPGPKGPGGTAPAPTTPGGTPSTGVFVGAPAYTATLGPSTIDVSGKGNGHLSFNADGNPAGRACLTCHDGVGKGGAPAFLFAGTVYEDKAEALVAAKVEVRMVGADGKGLSSYTDVNGNFFFRTSAGSTTVPASAGARTATTTRSMLNKLNDANCNQCHAAGSRISLAP
jgi:hypothetical protein